MGMFCTYVYMQFPVHCPTQLGAWQHVFHGILNDETWFLGQSLLGCHEALSARMSCMADVHLVIHLVAGENNLFSIDDDNVIPCIHMRGVGSFVFTLKDFGNLGTHATQGLILRIYNEPLALHFVCLR